MNQAVTKQNLLESAEALRASMQASFQELHELIQDSIGATHAFATNVDTHFDTLANDVSGLKTDVNELKTDVKQLKSDVSGLKSDVTSIKSDMGGLKHDVTSLKMKMVTKEYLDNKLADLRADLVLMSRKSNTKLSVLVDQLVAEKSLDPKVAVKILAMEPFPQN